MSISAISILFSVFPIAFFRNCKVFFQEHISRMSCFEGHLNPKIEGLIIAWRFEILLDRTNLKVTFVITVLHFQTHVSPELLASFPSRYQSTVGNLSKGLQHWNVVYNSFYLISQRLKMSKNYLVVYFSRSSTILFFGNALEFFPKRLNEEAFIFRRVSY